MNKLILIILTLALLIFGSVLQCGLTDMVSGQAMAMPFILMKYWITILLLVYGIAFFCDYKLAMQNIRYFAIVLQIGVVIFTVKRFLFYRDFRIVEVEGTRFFSDKYPPGDEAFMVVVFFSIIIFSYNFFKFLSEHKW